MSYNNTLYLVHQEKCIKDVSVTKAYDMQKEKRKEKAIKLIYRGKNRQDC